MIIQRLIKILFISFYFTFSYFLILNFFCCSFSTLMSFCCFVFPFTTCVENCLTFDNSLLFKGHLFDILLFFLYVH